MSLTILILTLLLSMVVLETDSCSSFTGWKLRHVDVEFKEPKIETEMTTKIDIDINYNNIKNTSRMQRMFTEPIILPIGTEQERCEEEFEQIFCHNHGKCYKIKVPESSHNEERFCICDRGYADKQCMTKIPDGEYRTIKGRFNLNQKDPPTTTTEEDILRSSTEGSASNEPDVGKVILCSEPFDQDFCINGQCYMLSNLIDSYFCVCHNDFAGKRCETKVTDHYYETRIRRDIRGSRRKKYKINPKFRQPT